MQRRRATDGVLTAVGGKPPPRHRGISRPSSLGPITFLRIISVILVGNAIRLTYLYLFKWSFLAYSKPRYEWVQIICQFTASHIRDISYSLHVSRCLAAEILSPPGAMESFQLYTACQ